MNEKNKVMGLMLAVAAVTAVIGVAAATGSASKDVSQKTSEATVVTNGNGTVSRTFTECSVTTNGNMVTEHRRETRTTTDADGNMLESSTSEYAQSYPTGAITIFKSSNDGGLVAVTDAQTGESVDGAKTEVSVQIAPAPAAKKGADKDKAHATVSSTDSFLGLKFGSVFKGTNFVADADEPTLQYASFKPRKALSGFDDYYAYVTPKTHRVVKVCACAKNAIEPGASWRRHYLIEALEKRYQTWARLKSAFRPIYGFDLGGGRFITTCLEDASRDYGTVIVAWDDAMLTVAADEAESLRAEELKAAAEKRNLQVSDAAASF